MENKRYGLRPVEDLAEWYDTLLCPAFPASERKPLETIQTLVAQGRYQVLGLYERGHLLGCAALWRDPEHPDWVLLDYLAVTETRRKEGLGEELLRRLVGRCLPGQGIVLETETPVPGDETENALRRRRMAFYRRCGFVPVYEMATCGARFQAMVNGAPPENLARLMEAHRAIYGPERVDVVIPLAAGETPPPSLF